MSFNWNNVKPACCAKWLVLPTVYSDALSYGEQLDKFCYQLNQLINNNNILPDFISEMIKEYINSGAIGEVVRDILANYILNVKYPPEGITPAAGDGSADDTASIQGCIDYAAENGGVVYFPYGSYLTQPLTMKDGVSLFGFDRYSTKIVLKGGATSGLITGEADNFSVVNLTLNGNSGVQVNEVDLFHVTGENILLSNLIFKNGYNLCVIEGTGGHLQISNIVFDNAVRKHFIVSGECYAEMNNTIFNTLSAVGGISVLDIGTNNGYYQFTSNAVCPVCLTVSGNDNFFDCIINNATQNMLDNGDRNNITIRGTSDKKFYSHDYEKTVGGSYSKHIEGNLNKIVTGTTSETYQGDRTINGINQTETFSGNKNINAQDMNLNITNPVQYKTPTQFNRYFDTIPFKDETGQYDVLVKTNETGRLNTNGFSVSNFGAIGDGITDDTNAIQYAVTYCNQNGLPLIFECGKTYLMRYADIEVNCDINFNGATIKISENSPSSNRAIFNVKPESTENISGNETMLNNYGVSNTNLNNKVFEIVSPNLLGTRGTGEDVYYTQLMVTDKQGKFVNTKYNAAVTAGNYQANNVHEISKKITLKNVVVDYGENANFTGRLFEVSRSNVEINGVVIKGSLLSTASEYATCVIMINQCAFINIKNIYGANPVVADASGYIIGIFNCSNVDVSKCNMCNNNQKTWGSIGASFITNISYENVLVNRVDFHYASFGYYTVKDCVAQYARVTLAYGTVKFSGVEFLNYTGNYSVVDVRQDYPAMLGGSLIFENCTFYQPTSGDCIRLSTVAISFNNENFNLERLNIFIKNCTWSEDSKVRHLLSINIPETNMVGCDVFVDNLTQEYTESLSGMIYGQIKINNCYMRCINVNGRVFDGTADLVSIVDSILGANPVRNNANSPIKVINYSGCYINNIDVPFNYETVMMYGCRFGVDKACTFAENNVNAYVNGNTIVSGSKSNQASWNNVIK